MGYNQLTAIRALAQALIGCHVFIRASATPTGRTMPPPWNRHDFSSKLNFRYIESTLENLLVIVPLIHLKNSFFDLHHVLLSNTKVAGLYLLNIDFAFIGDPTACQPFKPTI